MAREIGSRVYQAQYGEGTITGIDHGSEDSSCTIYNVQFDSGQSLPVNDGELFNDYTDFAERLAPDYHR